MNEQLKSVMANDLVKALQEASAYMTDRLILESLAKNGTVSLEEANFFESYTKQVVTEMAEEFVPETVTGAAPMRLTAEDGSAFMYNPQDGSLVPAGDAPMGGMQESTNIARALNEGTEIGSQTDEGTVGAQAQAEVEQLNENQMIVSNLIKNLAV